jgi:hypothetical protein
MAAKWRIRGSSRGMLEGFWNAMVSTFLGFDSMVPGLTASRVHQAEGWHTVVPLALRMINVATGLMMLGAVAAGVRHLVRRHRGSGWLTFFTLLYVSLFAIAGPIFFPWYAAPALPLIILAAAIGAAKLLDRLIVLAATRRALATIMTIATLALAAGQSVRMISAWPSERETHYRRIIEWLGPLAQNPSTLIAAMEVGTPGYYSRAQMLDLCGLVSPEMTNLSMTQAIERFKPAVVIAAPLGFAETQGSTDFQRDYQLGATLPWHLNPYLMTTAYLRRDLPLPTQPLIP